MRQPRLLCLAVSAVAASALAQPVPAELSALATKAGLDRPIAVWCRGEFRSGHPGEFAVATTGRYLVLETDATVVYLASFARAADLSCYSRAEAEQLNVDIGRSATIQGRITPRWDTTVICAFVDDTTAVCWQFSPTAGVFVDVGGWTT